MAATKRFLGIACVGSDIQSEGVDGLLRNLRDVAGATAVSLNDSVSAPSPDGVGAQQPPSDAGASVRLLDRPLFGRLSLWTTSAPAFAPRTEFYADSTYRPRPATPLTDEAGGMISDFLQLASEAGLSTYIQTNAITAPGLRDEDVPRLPDGGVPDRMVNTGGLASPAIRAWNHARMRDLLTAYPQLTGFRLDYAEYACYKLSETFQDFGPAALEWAAGHGFDAGLIRGGAGDLFRFLHGGLTNADLAAVMLAEPGEAAAMALLCRFPGVEEWLRLKAALSVDMLADWRDMVTRYGSADTEISINAFAPPFSLLTGFDFAAAATAGHASSLVPKLYTMHWSLMVEFWARELLGSNPGLDEGVVVPAITRVFDITDGQGGTSVADYGYPEPDEVHPVPNAPLARKVSQVTDAARGTVPVYPLVHGYGPVEDFRRRLQVVAESSAGGVWINRYAYLSDEKLDVIRDVWCADRVV